MQKFYEFKDSVPEADNTKVEFTSYFPSIVQQSDLVLDYLIISKNIDKKKKTSI
jgi:hypothetical protein